MEGAKKIEERGEGERVTEERESQESKEYSGEGF